MKYVAVIGPAEASPEAAAAAREVGSELARAGALLICGGGGGAMEAACRGAKAEGGTTVGILPGDDRRLAGEWVDVAVPTGMGEARNVIVVNCADALIAVGGGYGTLSEIALALRMDKPVIGLGTWEFAAQGMSVEIPRAASAAEAVRLALASRAATRTGPRAGRGRLLRPLRGGDGSRRRRSP